MNYPACKGANCGTTDGVSHSPECRQEHEDAIDGVIGRCAAPMWVGGCPAGTCGERVFGKRPSSRTLRNAWTGEAYREDGRFAGYVPDELACPKHGGLEQKT